MTWVKLDDGYATNPKVGALSDGAFRLDVAGLCYSSTHLTDGWIPLGGLHLIGVAGSPRKLASLAAELVDAGRWEKFADGWSIHDYLLYQESKAKVTERRAKVADRVAKHRDKAVSNDDGNAVTTPVTNEVSNPAPDPTRPDPDTTDVVSVAPKRRKRSRIPADYELTPKMRTWADENGILVPLEPQVPQFIDYHARNGTLGLDWDAGFRNWLRKAQEFADEKARKAQAAGGTPVSKSDAKIERLLNGGRP